MPDGENDGVVVLGVEVVEVVGIMVGLAVDGCGVGVRVGDSLGVTVSGAVVG